VLDQAAEQEAEGLTELHVQVSSMDLGAMNALPDTLPVIVQEVEKAGYRVIDMRDPYESPIVMLTLHRRVSTTRVNSASIATQPSAASNANQLEAFGRYDFLGSTISGIPDSQAIELTRSLRERRYRGDEAGVLADVKAAAALGGWTAIGAWRFLSGFTSDPKSHAPEVLDACVDAIRVMAIPSPGAYMTQDEWIVYQKTAP
jgi:hypothetical protein